MNCFYADRMIRLRTIAQEISACRTCWLANMLKAAHRVLKNMHKLFITHKFQAWRTARMEVK